MCELGHLRTFEHIGRRLLRWLAQCEARKCELTLLTTLLSTELQYCSVHTLSAQKIKGWSQRKNWPTYRIFLLNAPVLNLTAHYADGRRQQKTSLQSCVWGFKFRVIRGRNEFSSILQQTCGLPVLHNVHPVLTQTYTYPNESHLQIKSGEFCTFQSKCCNIWGQLFIFKFNSCRRLSTKCHKATIVWIDGQNHGYFTKNVRNYKGDLNQSEIEKNYAVNNGIMVYFFNFYLSLSTAVLFRRHQSHRWKPSRSCLPTDVSVPPL